VVVVEEAGYLFGTRLRTWTGREDRGFWRLVGPLPKYFSRGSQAAVVCRLSKFEVELNLCVRC
jgi:hypothetical protein